MTYCRKILPHIHFCKKQIKSLNETGHHIFKNKIDIILPQFPIRKEKRGIITSLITGFTGLAYDSISSFFAQKKA